MSLRPPTDPLLGIIPADPALRRVAVGGWAIIAVIGGGVLWYVTRALRQAQELAVYDPRGAFLEVQRVMIPAVAVGVIAGVGLSADCLVSAMRIFRAGRFPAPVKKPFSYTPADQLCSHDAPTHPPPLARPPAGYRRTQARAVHFAGHRELHELHLHPRPIHRPALV